MVLMVSYAKAHRDAAPFLNLVYNMVSTARVPSGLAIRRNPRQMPCGQHTVYSPGVKTVWSPADLLQAVAASSALGVLVVKSGIKRTNGNPGIQT